MDVKLNHSPRTDGILRVLRRLFGPKRRKVAEGWRRLHNEKLHNLYALPVVTRVIKSRGMTWAGHVQRMREMKNMFKILFGNLKGIDNTEYLGIDGRVILEWILGKCSGMAHLAQSRDQWRALVNTVMNFRAS
jgi:hypothetical protein